MSQIFFLLVFQFFCTSQILGSDHCDHYGKFESYLDAAIDLINKAKSYVPENQTSNADPALPKEKTRPSIDCAEMLHKCQNHSTIAPPTPQEKTHHRMNCEEALHRCQNHSIIPPTIPHEKANHPMDCEDVLLSGDNQSGVYTIWPRNRLTDGKPLEVYCDMDTDDGAWTVIQRRGNFNKSRLFFFKDWSAYKNGFGDINEDFWLGNDNIFALTNQREYSIRFDLKDTKGEKKYALYDIFWIDDEDRKYTLHIQNYSGDAGNSMTLQHAKQKFSTKDEDNDGSDDHCSLVFKGGWWYGDCCHVNLNGMYRKEQLSVDGIIWLTFTGPSESLIETEMKIRPRNFKNKINPIKMVYT